VVVHDLWWSSCRRQQFASAAEVQESQLARENAEKAAQLAKELPLQHEPLSQSSRYATSMMLQACQDSQFSVECNCLNE
jgi:hypothetical protein